ncbi:MAG: lyase family protein [Nitrososphaerota archaeon]
MRSAGRIHPLEAINPLDGRYRERLDDIAPYLSEYSLIKRRLGVEVIYLESLLEADQKIVSSLPADWRDRVGRILSDFSLEDAEEVKAIEKSIGHDVVAVMEYLAGKLEKGGLGHLKRYVHLGLTSEDINNIAYTTILRDFIREIYIKEMVDLVGRLMAIAEEHRDTPMLARTHGQPAVPTTFGRFIANYAYRLSRLALKMSKDEWFGKLGGPVGDLGSLTIAYPEIDWLEFQRKMLSKLGLKHFPANTQILPYENLAEPLSRIISTSAILSNMARDFWLLGMLGLVRFERRSGTFHSSTMPQKSNPLVLENAEGALDLAAEMLSHLFKRLIRSRLHRDLSDSILRRFCAPALATALLGLRSLKESLVMIAVNRDGMLDELNNHPEVWAEKIQVMLRRHGVPHGYELAREASVRGFEWLLEKLEGLGLEPALIKAVLDNSPETYLRGAKKMTDELLAGTRDNLEAIG